jgi:hypothetical protein
VVVVVVAQLPEGGVPAFARYERAVLELLGEHGGGLERRLRSEDGRTEVHLVRFPSSAALAAYRSDPRREAHRERLGVPAPDFEVFELREASIQELLGSRGQPAAEHSDQG